VPGKTLLNFALTVVFYLPIQFIIIIIIIIIILLLL